MLAIGNDPKIPSFDYMLRQMKQKYLPIPMGFHQKAIKRSVNKLEIHIRLYRRNLEPCSITNQRSPFSIFYTCLPIHLKVIFIGRRPRRDGNPRDLLILPHMLMMILMRSKRESSFNSSIRLFSFFFVHF